MSNAPTNAAGAALRLEANMGLAILNTEFTLVKIEAPAEYKAVGEKISPGRKTSAEYGPIHKTARKLGALFTAKVPNTPNLFKAYGTRVSEISCSSTANPRPKCRDKIFSNYVGVDSTSLWAAVTSGEGAIGVYLLACMLARMFNGPEAISLWDELVLRRKEEIMAENEAATYPSMYTNDVAAASHEFSREELANWDASARSWVRSADKVKEAEHIQLMLMVENVRIAVNTEKDPYKSVIMAWRAAIEAMDCLVRGIPQQVQNGAALLGMSSWHLYPQLHVLGGKTADIESKDLLFPESAVLTLGLQFAGEAPRSVSWSLPLSRMKYYGHPVQAHRSLGRENSRISMNEFAFVILGCVFGTWQEYALTTETGVSWLLQISTLLEKFRYLGYTSAQQLGPIVRVVGKAVENPITSLDMITGQLSWMGWLIRTAKLLHNSKGVERQVAMQLVALGRRRKEALCPKLAAPLPLFGLSDSSVLLSIILDDELRIKFLRNLAADLSLSNTTHIIRYQRTSSLSLRTSRYEYATVRSIGEDLAETTAPIYGRCLPVTTFHNHVDVLSCACHPYCLEDCPCRLRDIKCSSVCHNRSPLEPCQNNQQFPKLLERAREVEINLGECCLPVCEILPYQKHVSTTEVLIKFARGASFGEGLDDLSRVGSRTVLKGFAGLKFVAGDYGTAAIFEIDFERNVVVPDQNFNREESQVPRAVRHEHIKPSLMKTVFHHAEMLDFNCLTDWLMWFKFPNVSTSVYLVDDETPMARPSAYTTYTTSLRACMTATEIYKLLPDATISTVVADQQLWKAQWIRQHPNNVPHLMPVGHLTRAQAFACIAMFDSGTCNLEPRGLSEAFAMSSGDSIYVAAALLCDPFEVPHETEIRRVVGNIGRSGIALLVPPAQPKERERDNGSWTNINHDPFDGEIDNCFSLTTIHLGFTAYELPLSDGSQGHHHIIDRPASLIETLVSVHDRGEWIADLNVLSALGQERGHHKTLQNLTCPCQEITSNNGHKRKHVPSFEEVFTKDNLLVSIINWDEFLEAPSDRWLVVRAHQNWLARLAFTVMSVRRGLRTVVLPRDVCWECCKRSLNYSACKDLCTVLVS